MQADNKDDHMASLSLRAALLGAGIALKRLSKKALSVLSATLACASIALSAGLSVGCWAAGATVGFAVATVGFAVVVCFGVDQSHMIGVLEPVTPTAQLAQLWRAGMEALAALSVVALALGYLFKSVSLDQASFSHEQRELVQAAAPWFKKTTIGLVKARNAISDVLEARFNNAHQSGWAFKKCLALIASCSLIPLIAGAIGAIGGFLGALSLLYYGARAILRPIHWMGRALWSLTSLRPAPIKAAIASKAGATKAWARGKVQEMAKEGASSRAFALAEKADLEKAAPGASSQPGPSAPRL